MSADFYEYYVLLNIPPGATWRDLKSAYRSQMRKWHPDRFPEDSSDRQRAEERTKSINYAYDQLSRYHREHGQLPLTPTQTVAPSPHVAATPSANPDVVASSSQPRQPSAKRPSFGGVQRLFTLGGLGLAAYVLIRAGIMSGDSDGTESTISSEPATPYSRPIEPATKPIFGYGSTLGEVYAAQGIPTHTAGDIWHYGNSKIYFANGVVTRWEEHPSHPLNTRHHTTPVQRPMYFTVGASKADVRAVQGDPVRESQNVWDYGISRVYFEAERVVGWHESPMDPLKIKR